MNRAQYVKLIPSSYKAVCSEADRGLQIEVKWSEDVAR